MYYVCRVQLRGYQQRRLAELCRSGPHAPWQLGPVLVRSWVAVETLMYHPAKSTYKDIHTFKIVG